MSEQTSAKHGPAEDEAIKRQDLTELQDHGEEWPDPEYAGDGEPEGTWAPEARLPALEDWEAIELRSDLARRLDRTTFPATRQKLLEILTAGDAGQRLLDLVAALPGRTRFASLHELVQALGLPVQERPS